MGVGAGLYMCDVVKKFTFAISSPDEFLFVSGAGLPRSSWKRRRCFDDVVCIQRRRAVLAGRGSAYPAGCVSVCDVDVL